VEARNGKSVEPRVWKKGRENLLIVISYLYHLGRILESFREDFLA